MMKIWIGVVFVLLVASAWAAETGSKSVISKCQDIDGKWHYGDRAADECAQSKVTELDEQGYKRKEIAVPKTGKELEDEKAAIKQKEDERFYKKKQHEADQLILTIYESEANLIRTRDEKLAHIDIIVQANNNFMGKLKAKVEDLGKQLKSTQNKRLQADFQKQLDAVKAQTLAYEKDNKDRTAERKKVAEKFAAELKRYRQAVAHRDGLDLKPEAPKNTTPEMAGTKATKTEAKKIETTPPSVKAPDKVTTQP
ncbi:MAG TPA: hypothetical protein ENI80_03660 [Acidiferrobacteraceae bacterium]|nr:hypothetical protein [Acidiferrobacteraceae bacterium]